MLETYDPHHAPDPQEWLALDEDDRIDLVVEWHEASGSPAPDAGDWLAHAAFHVTVENQSAKGVYGVPEVLDRLQEEGLDRHDALHAVGSVLIEHTRRMFSGQEEAAFDGAAYEADLRALTAERWLADDQEELIDDPGEYGEPAWGFGLQSSEFGAGEARFLAAFLDAHRDEGALSYPEVAGLLFAVVCCPDVVVPSEWYPLVLDEANFEDEGQAQVIFGTLMALNNWIARQVMAGESPLPVDCEPDPDPMANFDADAGFGGWARGFAQGHTWLEESWSGPEFEAVEEELGTVMIVLGYFSSREMAEAVREETPSKPLVEDMAGDMLELIPDALLGYADLGRTGREEYLARRQAPARSHKIGRNDPCPCGSGKKYKKCCGRGD